ncbi:GlsB/YeaQ/YmgE family stress response membrane protein [Rothia sp. P7181]|uniref:GlsB/YeaQ/YmgE family stress response membrane protein n=1 Tax=unclassified Rothia (in: high G+C Gram-positive bacteria) TaxID=2689056 RepID=UPI003AD235AA
MGLITWIILGLIAGALAKFIMPGKQGGGFIVTTALGIVGAFIGGWLGTFIPGLSNGITQLSFGTIVTAVIGSLIALFIWGKLGAKN